MQEKTRRERGQFFAKGKLMVVSTEWWHPVDIDQYAYRKLENIWPAFVIFGLVRCIYIFVCDICWITREAGEKRRTAKERAAILLAYFLLQYILSWKPFAWDMICTKFLVHYFSLMFSIFAEEIFILEVNNPIYGLLSGFLELDQPSNIYNISLFSQSPSTQDSRETYMRQNIFYRLERY